ncbi:MAG: tyrosine-type recombinase/integrase [Pseudomonadales bacterium]|nr:tyrosine-type recombinase/integrase [Pseudomonadales bacterium]NRA15236.1 tyrosine-type recombinase/integrase [Oceanospirillaceae bacterium]
MNRPRKANNKDLPLNLYAEKKGEVIYYIYKNPKSGERTSFRKDRTQAILAANQLNTMLVSQVSLVDKVLGRVNTFDTWLVRYAKIREPEKTAKKTKEQLAYDIKLMSKFFGPMPIQDISVFHCSEFFDQWVSKDQNRMASRTRSQLIKCFDFAVGHGYLNDNPAKKTLPIIVFVKRKRLTREQFNVILSFASEHIQRAMMLGLITLQRREDIATMKFSDVKNGFLHVVQKKTEKSKKGKRLDSSNEAAFLRIEATPQLQDLIKQCRSTGVLSKYLIHHLFSRKSIGALDTEVLKGMPLQPDNITRGFARARNTCGLFDDMTAKERPTFHEIRSLGAHLYEKQGIDPQALLGHTSATMTAQYLDGHGTKWTEVSANLVI